MSVFWARSVFAIELDKEDTLRFQQYSAPLNFILSPKLIPPTIRSRPTETNAQKILRHAPLSDLSEADTTITLCHDTAPHSHQSLISQAGFDAQLASAHAGKPIENIVIQPRFSGLLGPSISFIRKDFENALRDKTGSKAKIMHNARFDASEKTACQSRFRLEFDTEYRGHHDFTDSDKAPLYRVDAISTSRLHMGQNFMASLGLKVPIIQNTIKDQDLRILEKDVSVGQDDLAFIYQGMAVDHATFNGFFTLKTDVYLSAQAGYLEEKFAGIGGEILYRPFRKPWAIGFDGWVAQKRQAREDNNFKLYDDLFTSAFINGWYDLQSRPVSFGLSLGRFLDGDLGGEIKALYKPASGWRMEGFARYSNEADKSLDNDTSTNVTAGIRLTAPLEQLRIHTENSRATFKTEPFGRDKRQRIHNAYPLYDLTDPWSAQNIYQNWDDVLE